MSQSIATPGAARVTAGAGLRWRLTTIAALIRLDLLALGWRDLAWCSFAVSVNVLFSVLAQEILYFSMGIMGLAGIAVGRVLLAGRGHRLAGLHCSLPVRREEVIDASYCLVLVLLAQGGALSALISFVAEGWDVSREFTSGAILACVVVMMMVLPVLTGAASTSSISTVVAAFLGAAMVLQPTLALFLLIRLPVLQTWPGAAGCVALCAVAVGVSWSVSRRLVRHQEY